MSATAELPLTFPAQLRKVQSAGEDFEWYPTTDEIIAALKRDLSYQITCDYRRDLSHAFLDIGAGNGKVLTAVSTIEDIGKLYAIEKSNALNVQHGKLKGWLRNDAPAPTVTAGGGHLGLVSPFLVKTANGSDAGSSRVKSLDEPMPTVCGNRGDVALIEPYLLGQQSGSALRPITEPAPTVSTAGAIALVEPFLVSFYGNGQAHNLEEPTPTVTCKDRFGLVRPVIEIEGNRYLLDIRFRMLQPHELALAQGFPHDYQFTGNKTDQVKQIGNAVPRRLARAIVGAVLSQNADVSALVIAEEARDMERGAA